jgi:hypothetical protein
MSTTAKTRQGTNLDFRGNKLLNLGAGDNAIADLDIFLADLNGKVKNGAVYGFVAGTPSMLNIAVLPFNSNNQGVISEDNVYANMFGAAFIGNNLAAQSQRNVFGTGVAGNKFGVQFSDNRVGSNVTQCVFGNTNTNNEIGNSCSKLVFGSACKNNVISSGAYNIVFGDGVSNSKVDSTSNSVTLGAGCNNVTVINCTGAYNSSTNTVTPFLIPANSSNVIYKNNVLAADPYGVAGKLDKAANLSDLQSVPLALQNLGLSPIIPSTASANNKLVASDDVRLLPNFIDYTNEIGVYSSNNVGGNIFGNNNVNLKTGASFVLQNNSGLSEPYPDITLPYIATTAKYLLSIRIPAATSGGTPASAKVYNSFGQLVVQIAAGETAVILLKQGSANAVFRTFLATPYTDINAQNALAPALAKKADLGADGKVPAVQLPSFVDDVIDDYANLAAMQAALPVGSKSVIYVTTDDNKQYRWSGSAYIAISASPGTTDAVVEGVNNLYFTEARSIGSLLTGYAKAAVNRAILVTDSVLTALGILEKKTDDNAASITTVQSFIPGNASVSNKLIVGSDARLKEGFINFNYRAFISASQYNQWGTLYGGASAYQEKTGLFFSLEPDGSVNGVFPDIHLPKTTLGIDTLIAIAIPNTTMTATIYASNGAKLITIGQGDCVVLSQINDNWSILLYSQIGAYSDEKAIAALTPLLATKADLPLVTPYVEQDVVTIVHGKNRLVMVQIYEADGFGTDAQIQQIDLNTVQVSFGSAGTGNIIVS